MAHSDSNNVQLAENLQEETTPATELDDLQAIIKALADAVDAEKSEKALFSAYATTPSDGLKGTIESSSWHDGEGELAATPEPTLDELLAAIGSTPAATPSATTPDLPAQVPQIEELWQELALIWPVVRRNPQVAGKIEELWRRLKQEHADGVPIEDLKALIDETTSARNWSMPLPDAGAGSLSKVKTSNSGEVADIVRRILTGESSAQIAASWVSPTGEHASADPLYEIPIDPIPSVPAQGQDASGGIFASTRDAATINEDADLSHRAIGIHTDELQLLERILGDKLDKGKLPILTAVESLGRDAPDTTGENFQTLDDRLAHLLREAGIEDSAAAASTTTTRTEQTETPQVPAAIPTRTAPRTAARSGNKPGKPLRPAAARQQNRHPETPGTEVAPTHELKESSSLVPFSLAAMVLLAAGLLWFIMGSDENSKNAPQLSDESASQGRKSAATRERQLNPDEMMAEFKRSLATDNPAAATQNTTTTLSRDDSATAYKQPVDEPRKKSSVEYTLPSSQGGRLGGTGDSSTSTVNAYDNRSYTYNYEQTPPAESSYTPSPAASDTRNDAYLTTLNNTTQNFQNMLDGSLDRLRTSTHSGLQDLSQRVTRLEDAIGRLQQAIDSLLNRSDAATSRQDRQISDLNGRLEQMDSRQKKSYQANIQRDKEGVTIVLTEPGDMPTTAGARLEEIVHVVVKGDTLWDIAAKYIHNPFRYPELARLSKIKNPDQIFPGDKVRIVRRYANSPSDQ